MAEATTHILRASLANDKAVYRDIELPGTLSLYDLAEAIVGAFDFDFDHPFGFYSGLNRRTMMHKQPKYEVFADMGGESDAMSVEKTSIADVFVRPGHKMMFLFDYGDGWTFLVRFMKAGREEPQARYPRIVGQAGEAPPQYPLAEDEED
jgi:hypothetical protein